MNINPNITVTYESNPQKNLKPNPEEEKAVKAIEKAINEAEKQTTKAQAVLEIDNERHKNFKLTEVREPTEEEKKHN